MPSDHLTPGWSLNVQVFWSSETFHESASSGTSGPYWPENGFLETVFGTTLYVTRCSQMKCRNS